MSKSSSSPLDTPRTKRKLSKMAHIYSQNRHSIASTGQSSPDTHPADPSSGASRPAHSRASSLLNFSFRSRTQSSTQQQQQQQALASIREGNGSTEATMLANEFGRLNPPQHQQQQHTTTQSLPRRSEGYNKNLPIPTPSEQQPQQLHPEIRSIIQLTTAHAVKIYFSGPLVKHAERHTDGRVVGKDEPWRRVWGQLGGTTLSLWDMEEIEEASKRGDEAPPSYLNVTDCFVHVLGSVTMPAHGDRPASKHENVITLTTAGMNLLLFSCENAQALIHWTAAFRLAAYEKSRLEEIYTAHLIRMSLSEQGNWKEPRSPLTNGRMEGWVQIRVAGQTDWKRLWMVVQCGASIQQVQNPGESTINKNRMSNFFSRTDSTSQLPQPTKPYIALFNSPKPKDRKRAGITMGHVSQVFAVYPERPELITRSTLIKIEGFLGDDELAGEWRSREGWILLMPEVESGKLPSLEMLRWLIALHDAFGIGGRPNGYTWNPREQESLMFAYPVGPHKDQLFLNRDLAESIDPREDRTSVVRKSLRDILVSRMHRVSPPSSNGGGPISPVSPASSNGGIPPNLPLTQGMSGQHGDQRGNVPGSSFQLPPLDFDNSGSTIDDPDALALKSPLSPGGRTSLSPITERTREGSTDHSMMGASVSRSSTQNDARSPPSQTNSLGTRQNSVGGHQALPTPIREESQMHVAIGVQRMNSGDTAAIKKDAKPDQSPDPSKSALLSKQSTMSSRYSEESAEAGMATQLPPRMTTPTMIQLPPSSVASPVLGTASLRSTRSPPPLSPRTPPTDTTSAHMVPRSPESVRSGNSNTSVLTSPFSQHHHQDRPSLDTQLMQDLPPAPPAIIQQESPLHTKNGFGEANDVQCHDHPEGHEQVIQSSPVQHKELANPHSPRLDEEHSESDHSVLTNPMSLADNTHNIDVRGEAQEQHGVIPPRRQTPMGFQNMSAAAAVGTVTEPGAGNSENQLRPQTLLSRRPSGARAPPSRKTVPSDDSTSSLLQPDIHHFIDPALPPPVNETRVISSVGASQPTLSSQKASSPSNSRLVPRNRVGMDESAADALAALSFLERDERSSSSHEHGSQMARSPPLQSAQGVPKILEPEGGRPDSAQGNHYRSSFAPSRQAAERKARSQAQQAAHDEAVHKPGRPNGNQKPRQSGSGGGWNDSSDEEDEEDEEEDEDEEDEDGRKIYEEQHPAVSSDRNSGRIAAPVGRNPALQDQMRNFSPTVTDNAETQQQYGQQNQQRPLRTLPQIPQAPRGRSPAGPDRRFDQSAELRRSQFDDGLRASSQVRPQYEHPQLGASRQNIFSSVLDAGRNTGMRPPEFQNNRDTFVQIESPAETMTKAFTPQGLLSAGLQDKQDRSAKRQEEIARETGASLINVPNKPPPPQTGLLGAISAHERERKREGGMGAALTEREREKRVAEERQRKLDDYQRQQLDQQQQMMAQGGFGMYGGGGLTPQMTGMNPMMFNPAMMGSMYFNPMQLNPGAMQYAQQAAMQAYNQAMYAMSQAGSQIGGEGGMGGGSSPNLGGGSPAPMGMMGTGNMSMGFDPRMSMMGMPNMGMGVPMGIGMGMGMPMGSPMGGPMNMQMTGGSGFDPRFSMGPGQFDNFSGSLAGNGMGAALPQRPQFTTGSPSGTPAPPPDGNNAIGESPRRSLNSSPKV